MLCGKMLLLPESPNISKVCTAPLITYLQVTPVTSSYLAAVLIIGVSSPLQCNEEIIDSETFDSSLSVTDF